MMKSIFLSIIFLLSLASMLAISSASYADDFIFHKGEADGWRSRVEEAPGLRVMWWNLGGCEKGKKKEELIHNLKRTLKMTGAAPDVLILGEYCPEALKEQQNEIVNLANRNFPHQYKLEKYTKFHVNKHGSNGMRVFSRLPLNGMEEVQMWGGKWLEGKEMSQCRSENPDDDKYRRHRYSFPYLSFSVKKDGQKYNLAGVHLPQPWTLMAECRGKIKMLYNMLKSKSNPTYNSAEQLTDALKHAENTLVIGDFNAPKKIKLWFWRYASKPYKLLRKYFGSSVIRENTATTVGAEKDFSIDHAFASDDLDVSFAEVIGFAGSDHKAIYVIVQPEGGIPGLSTPEVIGDFTGN